MVENTATQTSNADHTVTRHWQRVHPIALLYFLVKIIKGIIGNIVYLLPALYLGYSHLTENPKFGLPIMAGVVLLLLLITLLKFYFFKFRLHNNSLEIRSGIVAKKHINLPFERIQNVKLEQPLFYRPFDTVCLLLDTAGSHKQEANIVALKVTIAEQLKKVILASHHKKTLTQEALLTTQSLTTKAVTNSAVDKDNQQQERIVIQRNLTDLIIHGLSNNRIWIFIGGLAPFFDNIINYMSQWLLSVGINTEILFNFNDKSWWQIGFYAVTLTLIILVPITLLSIFGSVLSFYNFTLSKIDNRYIRRSGLITKHEVTMKLSRLQMIICQQDWLDRVLNRINLHFEQNQSLENKFDTSAYNNKIIIPSVTEDQCQALIDDAYPDNQLKNITFIAISKRYLLRNIGYILLPIYLGLSTFLYIDDNSVIILFLTPLFIILTVIVFLRWRRWGFALDNNYLYIKSGAIGVDQRIFPLYKVQQTRFKQSVFLQKHQLCHIRLILASGSVTIPYIKQTEGYDIIDNCLYITEKSHRSWM